MAAAAHGDFLLALFCVALSIPIVVWGSGLVAWLMNRYARFIGIGGAILGYVAGEMILDDDLLERWLRPDGTLRVGLPDRACGRGGRARLDRKQTPDGRRRAQGPGVDPVRADAS